MAKTRKFPLDEHKEGTLELHPEYPEYRGLPWYEEEFSGTGEIRCHACDQLITVYTHRFRGILCKALYQLYVLSKSDPEHPWVHYTDFNKGCPSPQQMMLNSWGLAEKAPSSIRYWTPTQAGILFITQKACIPLKVVRQTRNILAFCGKSVMLKDCFDETFSYKDVTGMQS